MYRAHRLLGGTQDVNTFKNVLYSRCHHFSSSQGRGATHIALVSGSQLAILHRAGREENWAYRDGYYRFISDAPPALAICRSEGELLAALAQFEPPRRRAS